MGKNLKQDALHPPPEGRGLSAQDDNLKKLPPFKFKRDRYMKKRGNPAMLYITCANCQAYIMCYQKDGPGPLKRCYLDRIHHPPSLKQSEKASFTKKTCPKIICPSCKNHIGAPFIYEKESRPAFAIQQGSVCLKKIPSQKR